MKPVGDIKKVNAEEIPDFDILRGGFKQFGNSVNVKLIETILYHILNI
jgi:site-specific DNA-cytosine methylase